MLRISTSSMTSTISEESESDWSSSRKGRLGKYERMRDLTCSECRSDNHENEGEKEEELYGDFGGMGQFIDVLIVY